MPTVPTPPLPGSRPGAGPTPTLPTTEELQALVPDELLDRINKFAFANAPAGTAPAPACKKQAPYTLRRRDDAVPAREGRHRGASPGS